MTQHRQELMNFCSQIWNYKHTSIGNSVHQLHVPEHTGIVSDSVYT